MNPGTLSKSRSLSLTFLNLLTCQSEVASVLGVGWVFKKILPCQCLFDDRREEEKERRELAQFWDLGTDCG